MIEHLKDLKEVYIAIGVGGLSFLVVILILFFLFKSILPLLQSIKIDGEVTKNIIENNTKAINEMSKSNDNVAKALEILDKSLDTVQLKMDATQENISDINKYINEIEKNISILDVKIN